MASLSKRKCATVAQGWSGANVRGCRSGGKSWPVPWPRELPPQHKKQWGQPCSPFPQRPPSLPLLPLLPWRAGKAAGSPRTHAHPSLPRGPFPPYRALICYTCSSVIDLPSVKKAFKTRNSPSVVHLFQMLTPLQFLPTFHHSPVPSDSCFFIFYLEFIAIISGRACMIEATSSLPEALL